MISASSSKCLIDSVRQSKQRTQVIWSGKRQKLDLNKDLANLDDPAASLEQGQAPSEAEIIQQTVISIQSGDS